MALSNPIIAGALQFLGGTANAYKEERDKRTAVANKKQMMGMEQQNRLDTMSHEQMLRQEEATRISNTPTGKANERKAIADAKYAENRVGDPIKALEKRVADAEKAEQDAIREKQEAKDKAKAAREQKEYEKQYDETVKALADRLEVYRNGDPSEDMDTLRKFVKKHRTTLQGEHNQIPFPDARAIADGEIIKRNLSTQEWEAKQVADRVFSEGQFQFGAQNMKPKAPLGQDAPAPTPAGDVSAIEDVLGANQPAPPSMASETVQPAPPSMASETVQPAPAAPAPAATPPSMGSETLPPRPTTPVGMGAEASPDIPSPESFGGPEELDVEDIAPPPAKKSSQMGRDPDTDWSNTDRVTEWVKENVQMPDDQPIEERIADIEEKFGADAKRMMSRDPKLTKKEAYVKAIRLAGGRTNTGAYRLSKERAEKAYERAFGKE